MLSPPVRRRCCVRRSRRRCTAQQCRLGTRKPLGSDGSRGRRARTRSIVATYRRPGSARPGRKPCAPNARRTAPKHCGRSRGSARVSAPVEPLDVTWFQPDLPKPLVHTRLAPRRATVRAAEEVLHRLREIPQRLLLHRLTPGTQPPVLGTGLGQLHGLLDIARSLAPRLPMLLLLHGQIPHIPRIPAVRQQRVLLLSDGHEPKPRHSRTVTATTDIPGPTAPAPLRIGLPRALKSEDSARRCLR